MPGMYPEHDCTFCGIAAGIAQDVLDGRADWGQWHLMPPVATLDDAVRARRGIFRGRRCKKNTPRYGLLSLQVHYRHPDGAHDNTPGVDENGQYTLAVCAWPVEMGRQAVIDHVKAGNQLAYNPRARR